MRKLLVSQSVLILCLFLTLNSFQAFSEPAEDHNGEEDKTEKSSTERPKQSETDLKTKETNLLSAVFRLPVAFINDFYGANAKDPAKSIPAAIDKLADKDEETISTILAELFSTLNEQQVETLLKTVGPAVEAEKEKEKKDRDERYLQLLERLLWAGKILDGNPDKTEGSQKYNAAFIKAFKDRQAKQEELKEKMKQAAEGNEEAKKFLRENVNRRAILAFIDAQRKSGNTKLANDLLEGLSFKEGNNKFIDTFANGESQRLNLGVSKADMEKSIQAYSDARGGLHNASLASEQHKVPAREFKLRANGSGLDESVPKREQAANNSNPGAGNNNNGNTGNNNNGNTGGNNNPGGKRPAGPNPNPNPGSGNAGDFNKLKAVVADGSKCNMCHPGIKLTGSSLANAKVVKEGKEFTLDQVNAAMKSVMAGPVSADLKAEFAKWAAKQ